MKTLLILALVLCSGFSAHAADDFDAATQRVLCPPPASLPQPVARLLVGYGLFVGTLASREVTLFSDGSSRVVDSRVVRDPVTGRQMGNKQIEFNSEYYFEPEIMAKIAAAASIQTGGKLVDQDVDKPKYMDGPGYQYYVIRNGQAINFAAAFGGHSLLPANKKLVRAAKYLKADLDNLFKAISAEPQAN